MDIALGFALGFVSLPLWWMLLLIAVFIVDVVLCENDEFGWGTGVTLAGTGLVAWLGADVNPITWLWYNLADVARFLIFYFSLGASWSIFKWYLYLLDLRDRTLRDFDRDRSRNPDKVKASFPARPHNSYARENKGLIMGWIAHWPFSMIGSIIGDFLTGIVKNIYLMLITIYDRISSSIFKDFGPKT